MALKRLFVDIQGDLFDVWNIISVEKDTEYNDIKGDFEFRLIILKNNVNKEAEMKIYKFSDQDERDNLLLDIKEKLKKNPNTYFLGENDGGINDEALGEMGYGSKGKKLPAKREEDGPFYEDDDE